MATNVTLPCNGHGLEIKAGSCWCDPPWTELDCSLTWSESSEYDFYNTYRITLITLGVIWTLIYTWRFLVVIPAKWRRARSHASSMLATPRRIAWTIFDDQFRCLIFGIITSVMSAINGSDPFAAETSPALHFNRYSVSIATDCARYAAVFLTVLLCTRFFIKLQAVFHPPSRVMLKVIDTLMIMYVVSTLIFIGMALPHYTYWQAAVNGQAYASALLAVLVIIFLSIYSIGTLQRLLPKQPKQPAAKNPPPATAATRGGQQAPLLPLPPPTPSSPLPSPIGNTGGRTTIALATSSAATTTTMTTTDSNGATYAIASSPAGIASTHTTTSATTPTVAVVQWTDAQLKTRRLIRLIRGGQVMIIITIGIVGYVSPQGALNPAQYLFFKMWVDLVVFVLTLAVLLVMGQRPSDGTTSSSSTTPPAVPHMAATTGGVDGGKNGALVIQIGGSGGGSGGRNGGLSPRGRAAAATGGGSGFAAATLPNRSRNNNNAASASPRPSHQQQPSLFAVRGGNDGGTAMAAPPAPPTTAPASSTAAPATATATAAAVVPSTNTINTDTTTTSVAVVETPRGLASKHAWTAATS